MITIHDRRTGDLFDRWEGLGEAQRRLLERSWAEVFRKHLLDHLPIEYLTAHFSPQMGRPTKDLHVILGALVLQQLHDLTDRATAEALAFNLAWHYALDVRCESDVSISERTLRNYRRMVIEDGLDEVLFRFLTDTLINAFSVDTSKQRVDSTALRSAMRHLTRLGTIVETINKFLRELARFDEDLWNQVDQALVRRYVERKGPGAFALTTPSESRRRLPEAGKDLLGLVEGFAATPACELASYRLLKRVFHEQFEVGRDTEDAIAAKDPVKIPCDNVHNPSDPDSSYNARRGQGYLAQIAETYTEKPDEEKGRALGPPDLITHAAVGKMTQYDGHHLPHLFDDLQRRAMLPERLLGDSHYGANESVGLAAARGVDLISPAMTAKGTKQGRSTLEDFELDERGQVTRCPQGEAPISTSCGAARIQARFAETTCQQCPEETRCLVARCPAHHGARRLQYTRDRVAQRRRRLDQRLCEFIETYRWRAGIEGTMSRLKRQMGLAHLRVRGSRAMRYVVNLRALGMNIHRCAAAAAGPP